MPKCIELLSCDWLISSLCYQAIEQVYIIKWSVSVYIKHTMNVYLKAVIHYFKVHYINKLHRTCCHFISVCVYLYFVFESVQVINGSQTGAAGASVCVCVCVCVCRGQLCAGVFEFSCHWVAGVFRPQVEREHMWQVEQIHPVTGERVTTGHDLPSRPSCGQVVFAIGW